MRLLLLIATLVAVTGYYSLGRQALTPELVNAFYEAHERATLSRDPEALCNQMADDFVGVSDTVIAGRRTSSVVDKKQACDAYRAFYEDVRNAGAARGGILRLGLHQELGDVSFSKDEKIATVNVAFRLTVSGQLMIFDGSSFDTLVRKRGRVYVKRSESKVIVETH